MIELLDEIAVMGPARQGVHLRGRNAARCLHDGVTADDLDAGEKRRTGYTAGPRTRAAKIYARARRARFTSCEASSLILASIVLQAAV